MYRCLSCNQAFFSVHGFLEAKRIEPRNNFYIQPTVFNTRFLLNCLPGCVKKPALFKPFLIHLMQNDLNV